MRTDAVSVKQYAQWWRLASYFISADKVADQMALTVPGQSYLAVEIWAKGKICWLRHRRKRCSWLGFSSSLSIVNRFECGVYGHSTVVQFSFHLKKWKSWPGSNHLLCAAVSAVIKWQSHRRERQPLMKRTTLDRLIQICGGAAALRIRPRPSSATIRLAVQRLFDPISRFIQM